MIAAGLIGISGLSLLIWLVLAFFRGGFWRADQRLDPAVDLDLEHWPSVVAVIPARNEAETIGVTVTSLLRQTYRGQIRVIVVDDNSDDATAKAAGTDKDLHVIHGAALAEGWTGKLWAVNQGVQAIDEIAPDADYVLLTDADIAHDPDNLRQLVCKAITDNCHLVSLMVALRCVGFWEKLLIPAFVFFFQKLYPFPLVNNPAHPMAAAAGGCMLVRLQTLRQTGGIAPIRDRLIDDCALAAQIKRQGPIWLGLSTQTRSLRAYGKLSEIWLMVARTAFVQLDHSLCNLLGTIVAMVLIYLLPPVLLVYGLAVHNPLLWLTAGGSCLLMGGLYRPTLMAYQMSLFRALTLPLAGLMYALMTLSSAARHWRGQGGAWKGRSYAKK